MADSQVTTAIAPPVHDRNRVKVYELRSNDWFDKGTGFCSGETVEENVSRIIVVSEEHPEKKLLETTIQKDGYQKQQETLIVWTAPGGTEMALSFQEPEGCAAIWEFVAQTQQALATPQDDALSDDAIDAFTSPVMLPDPRLDTLPEIDQMIRAATTSTPGRESLGKFIIEQNYFAKLCPLVVEAESAKALKELHILSNIMKMFILLNDNPVIEQIVNDSNILGVVGALEYDPDYPHHKANHRAYLQNKSRYKEVVPIDDEATRAKIHATWRLQYLKDVVLARMLDDPTFSVLNTMIFYNQVEIVQHVQQNAAFLRELFRLIDGANVPATKRRDAVCFLQQCCAIAKNLAVVPRASLYSSLIGNGLLSAIVFALGQPDAQVRIAGTDILVAMIDHDPIQVRKFINDSITERQRPLTDVLVNLLLTENDLGVKTQAADAIKILLDPQPIPPEGMARMNDQFLHKFRGNVATNAATEAFIQEFYDNGAKKLFQPLRALEERENQPLDDLTYNQVALYIHLVEILMYFVRNHLYRSKFFIASEAIVPRIGQLLTAPQKHLQLAALKFFRTCLGLQDEFYFTQIIQHRIFQFIIEIVYETMPRDNLLNSACLEVFEFVKRETLKPVLFHVVENYRDRLMALTYVPTFTQFVHRYDQCQGFGQEIDRTLYSSNEDSTPVRTRIAGANQRWQGARELDAAEEDYFNGSDEEDELTSGRKMIGPLINGSSPRKPLVDYPEDEDDENDNLKYESFYKTALEDEPHTNGTSKEESSREELSPRSMPPERLSEKRRREEDEEDELGKLSLTKRRNSTTSHSSVSSTNSNASAGVLRKKKSLIPGKDTPSSRKMTISLSVKGQNGIEADGNHNDES